MPIKKLIFVLCAIVFVFLCLGYYFSLQPLWLDEQFVLENIQGRTFSEVLTEPLNHAQAFPKPYLLVIKCLAAPFDFHPLALRFIPLICMLVGFLVWSLAFSGVFSKGWTAFGCIFTFLSSYRLVYYAAELKPYSMDVMIAGLFCLYLLRQKGIENTKPAKSFILFTILLPLTLLFSYASLFFFWIVIYNFIFQIRKNRSLLPWMAIYSSLALLALIFIYIFDLKRSSVNPGLINYWKDYFLCHDSVYCFLKSFSEGLRKLSIWWFGNSVFFSRFATFFMPLFLFTLFIKGPRSFLKKGSQVQDIESLGLVVFWELFLFGLLKKYPFTGERISLFFAPFVFYMIIVGINSLRRFKILYLAVNSAYFVFLALCLMNNIFLTYAHLL